MLGILEYSSLYGIWRVVFAITAILCIYFEWLEISANPSTPEDTERAWKISGPYSNMKFFGFINIIGIFFVTRISEVFIFIGMVSLMFALLMTSANPVPVWGLTPLFFLLMLVRLGFLKIVEFYPNSNKFLVGNNVYKLIGQKGILIKGVTPTETGMVLMESPLFKRKEMECISDVPLHSGLEVEITEVECGLIKVQGVVKIDQGQR